MTQLLREYRRRGIATCLNSLPRRLRHITVQRAVELLESMECGYDTVWWISIKDPSTRFRWTIRQFSQSKQLCKLEADKLHTIEFYGGPQNSLTLYKGTLLTVLMDRLLGILDDGGFRAMDEILPLQENYS